MIKLINCKNTFINWYKMKRFLILLLVTLPILSFSGPIGQLIKKAGTSTQFPGHPSLVVFDSTMVDVQESGLSYITKHLAYKVLTNEGANKLATITFDYDPLTAFVEIKEVIIHRTNGDVKSISADDIYDYPAPARMIYWGARQKMIDIGRLEVGDGIEIKIFRKGFTYALLYNSDEDRYTPPMKGHFYDIVNFFGYEPILEKTYEVSVPNSKKIQYQFYNGEAEINETKDETHQHFSFKMKNIMPLPHEQYRVANSDIGPKLLISTSPDWEAKSSWFYGVNEDFGSFESTPEIQEKVNEILEKAKNENDSISLLTHWVADEIRYSGISMGEGEGFTLHKGEMTFTDRCGVCKDKAGMLITMLRAAGFESYPAMTMAGSRIDDIPADQFNHCVTVVKKSDGQYHLLDPTWVPFVRELWSSAEQQQNYLMGIPEGADLMITPVSEPEKHYFKIDASSTINKNGDLNCKIVLTAEGQSDASIRRTFTSSHKRYWNSYMEEELTSLSPDIHFDSIIFDDPYDYSNPISISFYFNIPEYAVVTEKEIIFKPVASRNLFKHYNRHLYFNTKL
ncbi:MAG: transglutaminase [Marinilabiliales bacterium]|nr:MAG: transglutaminase [Marinilabiliales bacterium]